MSAADGSRLRGATDAYLPGLIALSCLWGSSYPFIRVAVRDIGPAAMIDARLLIAPPPPLAYVAWRHGLRETASALRRWWLPCVVLGVFNVAGPYTAISWAEQHIDSGTAAIGTGAMPLFVVLLAIRFQPDEQATRARLVGLCIGLGGVAFLAGVNPGGGWLGSAGALTVVASSFAYAASALYARAQLKNAPGQVLAAGSVAVGAILLAPLAAFEAEGDGVAVAGARVACLLDPREQEDAVVGGEAEGDRGDHQRLCRVVGAGAAEAEQALQVPALEDQHEDAEDGADRQQVEDHRLDRQEQRPRQREQHEQGGEDDGEDRPRQPLAEAALLVDEEGGAAVDEDGVGRGQRANPPDEALGSRVVAEADGVAVRGARGRVDGWVERAREVAAQQLVDLVAARAGRQDAGVDSREADAKERRSKGEQQRRGAHGDGERAAHHELGEPVPEAALGRPCAGYGASPQKRRGEGVDAGPEQGERGWEGDQRGAHGDEGDKHPAEAHREEKVLAEDEQRRECRGDGEAGEEDGAPGGRQACAAAPPGRGRRVTRAC